MVEELNPLNMPNLQGTDPAMMGANPNRDENMAASSVAPASKPSGSAPVAHALPSLKINLSRPCKKGKLSSYETDTKFIELGRDKGTAVTFTAQIPDPEVQRAADVSFMTKANQVNALLGFRFADTKRDSMGQKKIMHRILTSIADSAMKGKALAFVPNEQVKIAQNGSVVFPYSRDAIRDTLVPSDNLELTTPVCSAVAQMASRWYMAVLDWADKFSVRSKMSYDIVKLDRNGNATKKSTDVVIYQYVIYDAAGTSAPVSDYSRHYNSLEPAVVLNDLAINIGWPALLDGVKAGKFYQVTKPGRVICRGTEVVDPTNRYMVVTVEEVFLDILNGGGKFKPLTVQLMHGQTFLEVDVAHNIGVVWLELKPGDKIENYERISLFSSATASAWMYATQYTTARKLNGPIFGGLHSNSEVGIATHSNMRWDSSLDVSPLASNSWFILPYEATVEPRAVVRIRDDLIAEALTRVFPGTTWSCQRVGHIPETMEDMEEWLNSEFVTYAYKDIEARRAARLTSAWTILRQEILAYRLRSLAQKEVSEIVDDPLMELIRATQWVDEFYQSIQNPEHANLVFNGQILKDQLASGFIDDTVYKLRKWLGVIRKYFTPDCETIRVMPLVSIGEIDGRVEAIDELSDSIDDLLDILVTVPDKKVEYGTFCRAMQVKSQIADRFNITAMPVYWRLSYYLPSDINHSIRLPNGMAIPYVRPATTKYGGIDSLVRFSPFAVPGDVSHYGIAGSTVIRSQRSPIEQVQKWYYQPLYEIIDEYTFKRVYDILTSQSLPTTYLGIEYRPRRSGNYGDTWMAEFVNATNVGLITALLSQCGRLLELGIGGLFFPVSMGSCSGGAITPQFINNAFTVKVTPVNDDGCNVDAEMPLVVENDTLEPDIAGRVNVVNPEAPLYGYPIEVAKE